MCMSGGETHSPPAAQPSPSSVTNENEEPCEEEEEEEVDDKGIKAPLELVIEVK